MEENTRSFKGVWIPKEIWLDKKLSLQERCFLAEINSLDDEVKGCFALNNHFSELFGLSKNRCSEVIKSLEDKGFIKVTYEYKGKQIIKRSIKMIRDFYPLRKIDTPFEKSNTPSKNLVDRITLENNIIDTHNISFTYNIDLSKYDIDNESEFKEVIQEWLDYKKEKKQSYKSQSSLNIFIKRLVGLTGGKSAIARERVESSIANNYQGCLFQENKNSSQTRASVNYVDNPNDCSEDKKIFEEFYRQQEEERRKGK